MTRSGRTSSLAAAVFVKSAKLALIALMAVFFAVIMFIKLATEGYSAYVTYFTNWSWTFSALFYAGICVGYLWWEFFELVVFCFLWPVFGLSLNVTMLVLVVIWNNPQMVLENAVAGGGHYATGEVLVLNCIFHPLASLCLMIFVATHVDEIARIFAKNVGYAKVLPIYAKATIAFVQVYSPLFVMLLYLSSLDTQVVYGYQLMRPGIIFLVLGCCTLFGGCSYAAFALDVKEKYMVDKSIIEIVEELKLSKTKRAQSEAEGTSMRF
jgi:hypothetical protein